MTLLASFVRRVTSSPVTGMAVVLIVKEAARRRPRSSFTVHLVVSFTSPPRSSRHDSNRAARDTSTMAEVVSSADGVGSPCARRQSVDGEKKTEEEEEEERVAALLEAGADSDPVRFRDGKKPPLAPRG